MANEAFVGGFNDILMIGAAVAVIGGLLGLALVRQRDFVGAGHEEPQGEVAAEAVPVS
jgi:hypothetical protein